MMKIVMKEKKKIEQKSKLIIIVFRAKFIQHITHDMYNLKKDFKKSLVFIFLE